MSGRPPDSARLRGFLPPLLLAAAGALVGPWGRPAWPWWRAAHALGGAEWTGWLHAHRLHLLGASVVLFFLALYLLAARGWGRWLSTFVSALLVLHLTSRWLLWLVVSTPLSRFLS